MDLFSNSKKQYKKRSLFFYIALTANAVFAQTAGEAGNIVQEKQLAPKSKSDSLLFPIDTPTQPGTPVQVANEKPLKKSGLPYQSGISSQTQGYKKYAAITAKQVADTPAVPDDDRQYDVKARFGSLDGTQLVVRPILLGTAAAPISVLPEPGAMEYGLISFFQKALVADSKYKAAKADFEANAEALPQARAGYLPTVFFDYQSSSYSQNIMRASNPTFPTGNSTYPNENWTLTITQPVLKLSAKVKISQAELGIEQIRLNLVSAEQELILRVSSSYLGLLAAKDVQDMAQAEREAMQKQAEVARTRLDSGLGTITQLYEVEARFALAQAKEIQAGNKVDDARQGLKEIIGENIKDVSGFKGDFDAVAPQPTDINPWIAAAFEQNPALQARKLATQIAALEVKRQSASYLPTVNLVGTVGQQDAGGSIYGSGQKAENIELGLRINIPLYEGGLTSSLVREAAARQSKVAEEQEQELRHTERQVRTSFLGVQASTQTLNALRKAVLAQESVLQSKLEGHRSGLFNIVAVLDAYRLYFSARRDFLQERYDYLVNRLKLKMSVGSLSRSDLEDLSVLIDR